MTEVTRTYDVTIKSFNKKVKELQSIEEMIGKEKVKI